MSWMPATEPVCTRFDSPPAVELIIEGRKRDIDGFAVTRVLPSPARRMVGPFIFFDHMGPATFAPGQGVDVRPHPHINLATVTYVFEGEIVHRDSIGSLQRIRPGEINWMTAGRGIVHSERTSPELRKTGSKLHGIQLWVALPTTDEETKPTFHHHPAGTLPLFDDSGVRMRLLAGTAFGRESPVRSFSSLFYIDVVMPPHSEVELPNEHRERAAYVVEGAIRCAGQRFEASRMLVFAPGTEVALRAEGTARLMLLGGAPLPDQRHIWWNFVSSSRERIEQAKRDWKEGRFAKVPGDDIEFVPLPES
jgi:redox-sensitive bicupin YhaK (pirin superfamily)